MSYQNGILNTREEYEWNSSEEDFSDNEIDFSLNLEHAGCENCSDWWNFCACTGKEEFSPPPPPPPPPYQLHKAFSAKPDRGASLPYVSVGSFIFNKLSTSNRSLAGIQRSNGVLMSQPADSKVALVGIKAVSFIFITLRTLKKCLYYD
ncbi:hypothetical protein JTB14_004637 [Gonioctena quinquepunctata]|nr:hypothetical protein JTB14_004637 [Gonioctena quinquepunctata]